MTFFHLFTAAFFLLSLMSPIAAQVAFAEDGLQQSGELVVQQGDAEPAADVPSEPVAEEPAPVVQEPVQPAQDPAPAPAVQEPQVAAPEPVVEEPVVEAPAAPAEDETSTVVTEVSDELEVVTDPRAVACVVAEDAAPWIASDLADYPPGALVTLTGGGWVAGQTVEIFVDDDGVADDNMGPWSLSTSVVANGSGQVSYQFNLPNWFVANYFVTATGECSTVTTTFTDALQIQGVTLNTAATVTVAPGEAITAAVNIKTTANDPWKSTSWRISTSDAGTFSCGDNEDVTSNTNGTTKTFTIKAPQTPGTYNAYFVANSGNGCNGQVTSNMAVLTQAIVVRSPEPTATSLTVAPASGTYGGTTALTATLTANNSPVSGKSVTFTLNGVSVGTATTNAQGVTSLSASLTGINAGSYPTGVGASFAGDSTHSASSNSASLTVAKADQTVTITSDAPAGAKVGDTYTVEATASGGGAITFSTNNQAVCTVSGAAVTLVGVGTCVVTASAAETDNHKAGSATQSFTVGQASSSVTVTNVTSKYGETVTLEATASGAGNVTFSVDGTAVATVGTTGGKVTHTYTHGLDASSEAYPVTATFVPANANFATSTGEGTLKVDQAAVEVKAVDASKTFGADDPETFEFTITGGATRADFSGGLVREGGEDVREGGYAIEQGTLALTNNNYTFSFVEGIFTINPADQIISFDEITNKTYGDEPFELVASATSGLDVTFVVTSGTCKIEGNVVTITGAGDCTITALQGGNNNYNAAENVSQSFRIDKAEGTLELSGLTGNTYDGEEHHASVNTDPAGLGSITVTYKDADGKVVAAPVNAGSYDVTATLDNPNYTAEPATGTLVIDQAEAELKVDSQSLRQVYDNGKPRVVVVTTDPVNLDGVSITYNGSTTAPTGAGTYDVVVTLNNGNYKADEVETELFVDKATTKVESVSATDSVYGAETTLGATVQGAGTVKFTVGETTLGTVEVKDGNATLTVKHNLPASKDAYTVTATLIPADGDNYEGSSNIGTLTIGKATATISLVQGDLKQTFGETRAVGVTKSPTTLEGVTVTYTDSKGTESTNAPLNAGTYQVKATLTNDNYTATDATGTLVIDQAVTSVKVSATSSVYGGTTNLSATVSPAASGSVEFFINQVSVGKASVSEGKATLSGYTHGLNANATAYSVRAVFTSSDSNYKGSEGTGSLKIDPVKLKVDAFLQPIDTNVVNTTKGGSTVPVKFRVYEVNADGSQGKEITETAKINIKVVATACPNSTAPVDEIEQTATGGTSLRYDTASGHFIYNYQTTKTPGKCVSVTVIEGNGNYTVASPAPVIRTR